jgi:hypothetical protein
MNLGEIKSIILSLPPFAEQKRIVEEVERRLRIVDELEKFIISNLESAEDLRRAILKRAFDGGLVPQDPNDEPASMLLKRITTERERRKEEAMKERQQKPQRHKGKKEKKLIVPILVDWKSPQARLIAVFDEVTELPIEDLFLTDYIFRNNDVDAFFAALTACLRSEELVYRREGDEFLVRREAK